jgi:hypothetical protein
MLAQASSVSTGQWHTFTAAHEQASSKRTQAKDLSQRISTNVLEAA